MLKKCVQSTIFLLGRRRLWKHLWKRFTFYILLYIHQFTDPTCHLFRYFFTNQIASNEINIVMTPFCPTPHHLLHMKEGVNLVSLMMFKMSLIPNCSLKWLSDALHWWSKWTLGHRRKKRGNNTSSFHFISLSNIFIQSLTRKGHFLDIIFVVFTLSNELDEEYIKTICRSFVMHELFI